MLALRVMQDTTRYRMSPNPLSNHLFRTLSAYTLLLCALMSLDLRSSFAEPGFNFNWTPITDADGRRADMICNFPGIPNSGSCEGSLGERRFFSFQNTDQSGTGTDATPFVQEVIEVGGVQYYHVIVGDGRTQDFAQEVYIRVGGEDVFADGNPSSSSGGRGVTDETRRACSDGAPVTDACGNGLDPLRNDSRFTGTGTGNPERVIMRQLVKSGGLVDTFEKTSFALKPKLIQTLSTPDLSALFSLDMSNSDYKASTTADNATPGIMVNTLNLINSGIPANGGNFGVAGVLGQTQNSTVTGGRFTWAPGPSTDLGFSSGTYTYDGGNFNVNAVEWDNFKN